MSMTHYDGNDVLVLDDRGVRVRAVDEVCVEPDRAAVHLKTSTLAASDDAPLIVPDSCTIHSLRDGKLRWRGPVRLVCV